MKGNVILAKLMARGLRRFPLELLCNSRSWRLWRYRLAHLLVWLVWLLVTGVLGVGMELGAIAQENAESADTSETPNTPDTSDPTFLPALSPQYPPPELNWLQPGAVPPNGLITSSTISLSGLTPPSLWWTDQQFGGKTLRGWIAYPGTDTLPPRVDLVVNRQLWGLSDYLERYSFVHHFGRAAQSFGYTIRVFNDVGDPLAIYPCPIHPCSIIINSSGIGARDNDPFSNF